jgi:hypothetical protein
VKTVTKAAVARLTTKDVKAANAETVVTGAKVAAAKEAAVPVVVSEIFLANAVRIARSAVKDHKLVSIQLLQPKQYLV